MKDLLKRIIVSAISGAFIGYLWFLFFADQQIVVQWFSEFNILYFIVLAVIWIYLFVLFGIHPMYMKITKTSLFVLWISLVLMGDSVLINDSSSFVYVSDFAKILGSFLTVLAWTNFFITWKAKKRKEESKIEIIEA